MKNKKFHKCAPLLYFSLLITLILYSTLVFSNEKLIIEGKSVELKGNPKKVYNGGKTQIKKATQKEYYLSEIEGGDFSLLIDNIPKGNYKISVYLTEQNGNSLGKRIFSVNAGDLKIAENLDIFSKVGFQQELVISGLINHQPNSTNKKIEINFKGIVGLAKFNAIKIDKENGEHMLTIKASQFENNALKDGNPFIKTIFTADPSAHVFEGKMFIYPSHDRDDAKGFDMTDYHVFSSKDLLNWEDHGVALDVKDIPWAKEFMWAPDCVFKNGIYYFYFPVKDKEGVFRIGVATGKSPKGPFLPETTPIEGSFSVDQSVFIDDDGKTYMYFGGAGQGGQKNPWVAKMADNMLEFSETPKPLLGIDYWFEACWMNKIGNTYYLSYSTGGKHPQVKGSSGIAYATSDNPMGPFKYQGLINNKVSGWTNHHSIVEWKGQTYFFYHTSDLSGGKTNKRSLAADYIHITNDGVIQEIIQTKTGIGKYDGTKKIEAENFSETKKVIKKGSREKGIYTALNDNDFIVFNNVDFGTNDKQSITFSVSGNNVMGTLEVAERGANKGGKVLVKIPINLNSVDENWKNLSSKITKLKGIKNIEVTFKSKNQSTINIDWFELSK